VIKKAKRLHCWYLTGDDGTLMLYGKSDSRRSIRAKVLKIGIGHKDDLILIHTSQTIYGCCLSDAIFLLFDVAGEAAVPGLTIFKMIHDV